MFLNFGRKCDVPSFTLSFSFFVNKENLRLGEKQTNKQTNKKQTNKQRTKQKQNKQTKTKKQTNKHTYKYSLHDESSNSNFP